MFFQRSLVGPVCAAILLMAAGPAAMAETATPSLAVRSGNHPTYGRVTIDSLATSAYHLDQDGDRVTARFGDGVSLGTAPPLPRNVAAIKIDGQVIELTLKHGGRLHAWRLDGRVVLDVLDPKDTQAAAAKVPAPVKAAAPDPKPALSVPPAAAVPPVATAPLARVVAQPLPPPAAPAAAAAPEPAVELIQHPPPGRDVLPETEGPVVLRARRVRLPKDMEGSAFLVPFDSTTGAAAFQSLGVTYIAFDERRPVDMAALRNDPAFATATVQMLPSGTLFRLPLPAGRFIALTQMSQGWRIAALTSAPKQQPITASYADGHVNLAAEQPGDVISLADPDTGATLLAGTQHRPGQGVTTLRRGAGFALRPTIQGVVVEALSDAVTLKQVATGFSLGGGVSGLALSSAESMSDTLMDAAHLTRRLDFSNMPSEALLKRANKQLAEAALSPAMARGLKHHAAAASLMALGMSVEAESLLRLAAEQDPKEAASADTGALTAIAALLAGRPDEADALMDPRLDGTDEIALWRAVRQAMRDEGSPAAAAVFAATASLVSQYPAPIRDHILPLVVETMIQGGEIAPAARLLRSPAGAGRRLAYARALMQQADGNTTAALGMLDGLAAGHDQFDRARAATRAVELRLAGRELDTTQAADALDTLLFAWRGDRRELALRERIADLRGQAGAWPVALATLRQAETDFPDQAATIHERLKDAFAAMIRDQGATQIPALAFVSMVDENTDLIPDSGEDATIEQSLLDRLLALDLPAREKPLLEKLLHAATSDVSKARFGASLATLDLREGDDAGARTVLEASDGRDLPADLFEQRAILRARSIARLGDPTAAAALLAPLRTAAAIEARAQILETASDWAEAATALSDVVTLTVAETGMLDEAATRMVLRLATDTARASDEAGLTALKAKFGDRIGPGPLGDMFRLLTAAPIRTTADIGRSQREVSLAASLPADLKALQAVR